MAGKSYQLNEAGIILRILLISFLTFSGINSYPQKLLESRKTSYFTYIYKLTDKEAKKIYKRDIWVVDSSFFHTLIDSFPTDSGYKDKLPVGHYMRTFAEKDKQKIEIATVQNFDVFILNNNTDLCVRIYDLQGNIINDADVRVQWKKLHFNKKVQAYTDKKSNRKGLLKVSRNGFTAYYNLEREHNNPTILRDTRKLIYETPLKYVWIPINYVAYIPVDAVKSVVRWRIQGTIGSTARLIKYPFKKLICLFDDNYCNRNAAYKFSRKHTGYIVFNKPKYLPGDTVKFKAFLTTKRGNLVNKTVKVKLELNRKIIELTKLKPYRKGAYEYEFLLHDSLKLQLDRDYYIKLELNDWKEYISGSFKYEDYELSKINLSVAADKKEQYRNSKIKLSVKGTDENDLNLQDARIEILAQPNTISEYFEKHEYIPDTLLFIKKKLDPVDETEVFIADSVFPKANFNYNVYVRLLTSDNESVSQSEKIQYFFRSDKFITKLLTDSIDFQYQKDGISFIKPVSVFATDNFGNETEVFQGNTPCRVELNPYYSSYTIRSDSLSETTDISSQPSLIKCFSERTPDSIKIVVDNPRKIPFSYNIYGKNTNKSAGYSDSLDYEQKSASKQNYFVSIRYLWGGEIKNENYRIPLVDDNLNVMVIQPKIVYPGQKSRIEVLVTDIEGKPVEGADVTAYSLTKKFDYSAPGLPYPGKNRKNKQVINNFHFVDFDLDKSHGRFLNYNTWKLLAGLDTIEYYRFIYPGDSIYRFRYYTSDSVTQFAPFVTWKGALKPIHVIYVDSRPVYFSWSTNIQPYSFKINSGYHQVKLRTSDRNIIIDSLYFRKGEKMIFSIDEDSNKKVKTEKMPYELSLFEKRLLYKYIFPYRNTFRERYAFIEDGNTLQFLAPKNPYQMYNNLAGPVSGYVKFNLLDSFSTGFFHEPDFEYEFEPGLLKMRSYNEKMYPRNLYAYSKIKSIHDEALTKKALYRKWKDYVDTKRYETARYLYPSSTSEGNGRLLTSFTKQEDPIKDLPLNILVFRYDNHEFLRVYPGNITLFHELREGYYKILFFYSGSRYHIEDSIYVKPNGLNYYEIDYPLEFKKDSFSVSVSKIIEETIFNPVPHYYEEEKELKQIFNRYQQEFKYTGDGETVEGFVYDNQTGEPLPGVTIIVKGTTYGTITDLNGYYSLKVPSNNNVLIFSFIGYLAEELPISYNNVVNVNLTADIQKLDEVVVIGYGVVKKYDLTGSLATVTSQSLLGSIPGVSGNISQALQGKAAGVVITQSGTPGRGVNISIRGCSAPVTFNKSPLYIINGNVFTGDISELDPSLIQNIQILKDENATAIYGAKGANGVVILETNPGAFKSTASQSNKGADFDEAFLEAASQSGSIRENFSDYAFWQPKLKTDKEGKAYFEVTFPDDVTSWNTYYLVMNKKRQSGQAHDLIKSYKPLMAQVAAPRFLIEDDTCFVIGKVLNYTPDSVEVTAKFIVNNETRLSTTRFCNNSLIDSLPISASDSVLVKYYIENPDGYFDGELRNVSVFPKGLEKTKGNFHVLDNDTALSLSSDTALGNVTIRAKADIIEVIEDEISHLINYKYSCNEQIASKLKVLIAEKNIALYKGEKFKHEKETEKLIRLLNKNQKNNGLWGWWKDSEESYWISLHVLEALLTAEKSGYKSGINKGQITEKLIWELESSRDFYKKVRILRILRYLNAKVNYSAYIAHLEKIKKSSLNEFLQVTGLKQLCDMKYNLDTLKYFRDTTLFGNIFYSDQKTVQNILVNDVQNTILAYGILRYDSADHTEILHKIRNYFMESRKTGYWQNTFESAQIIETILPDLLAGKTKLSKPVLTFTGGLNKVVTEFPFDISIDPGKKIEVTKTGDFPVYLTSYQRYWDRSPRAAKNDFEIITRFNNDSSSILEAGKETTLITEVNVKKDAEYVMINIPVPAGCSYADKENNLVNETHREYFKNETTIFCENLTKGKYIFKIKLIPRYTGTYTINPAKIELMYFPTFSANNETKKITIR